MLEVSLGILTRTCSRGQCMESWISVLSVICKRRKSPFTLVLGTRILVFFPPAKQNRRIFPHP